jgi:hypothetical protein
MECRCSAGAYCGERVAVRESESLGVASRTVYWERVQARVLSVSLEKVWKKVEMRARVWGEGTAHEKGKETGEDVTRECENGDRNLRIAAAH